MRSAILRDPHFLRYLLARALSATGSVATLVALPVLVYRTSHDAGLTALVAGCQAAPYLLFGLFSGALTDRWNRHRVMVVADVLSTLLLATIPLAALLGRVTVPHVLAVAFLGPTIGVFLDGAVFGALPMIVGRDRIAEATSVTWSVQSVLEIVVPSVVGVLIAVLDPAWLLGFDAVTFAVSAVLVSGITRPLYDASRVRPPLTAGLVLRDIREGLAWLGGHAGVRTMTLTSAIQNLSLGGYMALTVVWLDRVLGLGTEGWRFGITYAAWALGGLVASLSLPRLIHFLTPAQITLGVLPAGAVIGIVVSRLGTWWLVAPLMVAWSYAATMGAINAVSYRQQVTPEHLLGRVNTAGRMLSWGVGWTGGALLSGVVVGPLGLRATMLAFACVQLVAVAVAWTSPLRRAADARSEPQAVL
ncbi:MFS transporter [Nocardioides sp. LS1]|uniref:MFS transporter n=1 Tax=Nocardioides sp. LS1 TaxID=1027620 RepID=UPI000FF94F28|nr:MFS transporter [Nocardioides sp. LS1]GCD91861.1 MFS transporter [Nocardioides sp. LS1]